MSPQVVVDTALHLDAGLATKVTGVTIPVAAAHMIVPRVTTAPVR